MNLDPLNLQTNPEFKDMRIETVSIYPRSINDDGVSGGQCSFVFPKRGYLSGESRIILPATCINDAYQYVPSAGVFSLIQSASLSTESSGVIAQVDNANELYSLINNLEHCEKKDRVDNVLHGVNFSFETASGSKLDAHDADSIETLPGQYRLVCDEYKPQQPSIYAQGTSNNRANQMSAHPERLLKTFYNDTDTEAGTPEYSISLQQLFPGFFKEGYQLPLALIAEEVLLEINFSKNGQFGNNDRAIYCPDRSTETASSMIAVGIVRNGAVPAGTGAQTDVVLSTHTSDDAESKGKGLRLMYDIEAGNTALQNIRVLDAGTGYNSTEQLTFNITGGTALVVTTGYNFSGWDASAANDYVFYVDPANKGQNYAVNDVVTVTMPGATNPVKVKVTAVDAGNSNLVTKVQLQSETENNQFVLPYGTGVGNDDASSAFDTSGGSGNGALKLYLVLGSMEGTGANLAENKTFAVGDIVEITASDPGEASRYIVATVNANMPTKLLQIGRENLFEKNVATAINKVSDADATCDFTPANNNDGVKSIVNAIGLGYDPVFSFGDNTTGKIKVQKEGVMIATDLIYYMDGKFEADQAQVMNKGINYVYTQYRNITSTLEEQGEITEYGKREPRDYNRLIGFSNEILRSLFWNVYPSGTQNREKFPYYNKQKLNPLLNKYCSRSSLVKDGQAFNVNVNSIPYYSSRVETDMRAFTELNKVFDRMFYINKGCYQGWAQCRQDSQTADLTNDQPSNQPGFTTNDSIDKPTLQYQINERKAGIVGDGYMGIPQKYMRGQYHPQGVSFKVSPLNQIGNGVAIGSTSVDVQLTHNDTYNPYYSGSATLSLYGEVERVFSLKMGRISVTSASM